MPQVRITASTVANRTNVRPGDIVHVSDTDARLLVRIGKAEWVTAPAKAPAALLQPPLGTRGKRNTHPAQDALP